MLTARRQRDIDTKLLFAATGVENFGTERKFRRTIRTNLHGGNHKAVVYVHGFYTTFGQGIYRVAQLSHDFDIPGVTVYCSWQTLAPPFGYACDRASALFARDRLETLLQQLDTAGVRRTV